MREQLPLEEVVDFYAGGCRHLGSTFYCSLLERMAADVRAHGPVAEFLAGYETTTLEDAVPLRLLGGVHRQVLEGDAPALAAHFPPAGDGDPDAAWLRLVDVLTARGAAIRDALTRPPQTNEVGRSVPLIGGFLEVARTTALPLRILELGTSAALNLRLDRYWFEADGLGVGDPTSPVRFVDHWTGGRPPFEQELTIVERRGCDRHPIDATTDEGRLTLLSYVWPDQTERLEILHAALLLARDFPVAVDRADIPVWLAAQLREPMAGVATVVFHSIVWQYLSESERADAESTLAAAGDRATTAAPLAWLRLEPSPDPRFAELRLTTWPGGEENLLATSKFHIGQVEWLG